MTTTAKIKSRDHENDHGDMTFNEILQFQGGKLNFYRKHLHILNKTPIFAPQFTGKGSHTRVRPIKT